MAEGVVINKIFRMIGRNECLLFSKYLDRFKKK